MTSSPKLSLKTLRAHFHSRFLSQNFQHYKPFPLPFPIAKTKTARKKRGLTETAKNNWVGVTCASEHEPLQKRKKKEKKATKIDPPASLPLPGRGLWYFTPFWPLLVTLFFLSGSVSLARVNPPLFLAVTGFALLFNILDSNAKRHGQLRTLHQKKTPNVSFFSGRY